MSEETAWIAERDTILKPHGVYKAGAIVHRRG
jgi:hypothetical protein